MITLITALLAAFAAVAQVPAKQVAPRTTLIIFPQHNLKEAQWSALLDALRRGIADANVPGSALSGPVILMRGDRVPRGIQVDDPIAVFLQGDCTLISQPRLVTMGALGWVMRVNGVIKPFIHVDCEKIVQMLGPLALGMSYKRRDAVMGEAITRVILHEWIHISTQNAGHSEEGITKPSFALPDLLADDKQYRRDRRNVGEGRHPRL